MTIATRDLDALLSIQNRVLSCPRISDLPGELLVPAQEFLNATTSCFLQINADKAGNLTFRHSAANNVSERAQLDYVTKHFREDPAIAAAARNCGSRSYVFCTADVYDYAQLTNTSFYHDFFRPNHIHHVLVMAIRPTGDSRDMMLLGFHRPSNDSPFKAADKRNLQHLASALSCSVKMLCMQNDLAMQEIAVAEYSRSYPEHGLLFFDQNLALLYGNETGLQHASLDGSDARTRLERIARACGLASRSQPGADPVPVDFSEAEDVIAKISPLRNGDGQQIFAMHTNRRMTEAVFITRCKKYELSQREVEIARTLASGLSNLEIADRLGISFRTVENHLRAIYAKVGVNRRTQLLSHLNDL